MLARPTRASGLADPSRRAGYPRASGLAETYGGGEDLAPASYRCSSRARVSVTK
jgi:hypothetical protein